MELLVNSEEICKKKEELEPHKILVTITSLSISQKLDRQELRRRVRERFRYLPLPPKRSVRVKTVVEYHNKIRKRFNLSLKPLIYCSTH